MRIAHHVHDADCDLPIEVPLPGSQDFNMLVEYLFCIRFDHIQILDSSHSITWQIISKSNSALSNSNLI